MIRKSGQTGTIKFHITEHKYVRMYVHTYVQTYVRIYCGYVYVRTYVHIRYMPHICKIQTICHTLLNSITILMYIDHLKRDAGSILSLDEGYFGSQEGFCTLQNDLETTLHT